MANSSRVSDAPRGLRHLRPVVLPDLPVYRLPRNDQQAVGRELQTLVEHEWLVTNGIGGYSSSTVSGMVTRRYHGLLVAALSNPLGRTVMFNALLESAEDASGRRALLSLEPGAATHSPSATVVEFRLHAGIPVWRYSLDAGATTIEKRIFMPYRQNTVVVQYRVSGEPVTLHLTPAVHCRRYEAPVSEALHEHYAFAMEEGGSRVRFSAAGLPPLHVAVEGKFQFIEDARRIEQIGYAVEEARGYDFHGSLWSAGTFVLHVASGESVALIGSTEDPLVMLAMTAAEALDAELERRRRVIEAAPPVTHREGEPAAQLVMAADQFIIRPVGRVRDTTRATAVGDEIRTVIAGYHWFTDWGRDTMVSLEGLTLATGRQREAGFILRTFAQYVRDGLIPNLFPDGSDDGLYHTADATLWFFHAIDRYAEITGTWSFVEQVLPVLRDIVEAHLRGTRFGIAVDPADGLLRQGAEGYQLTWMDAKVDGWVVTRRAGKAVEINALWYNALRLMSRWECDLAAGEEARSRKYGDAAARARASFNQRFWFDEGGYLYDVIDGPSGNDSSCRPNQILAISLPNPVLDEERWPAVLEVVRERLLTPVGLRSLAPGSPDYKARYFGDLRTRDSAYHQGTVWAWLIGPWVDAWLKVHPDDRAGARKFLAGLIENLPAFGVGSIGEIFDAEPPYTPRGCIAQAWSVAEVLRCLLKTGGF